MTTNNKINESLAMYEVFVRHSGFNFKDVLFTRGTREHVINSVDKMFSRTYTSGGRARITVIVKPNGERVVVKHGDDLTVKI